VKPSAQGPAPDAFELTSPTNPNQQRDLPSPRSTSQGPLAARLFVDDRSDVGSKGINPGGHDFLNKGLTETIGRDDEYASAHAAGMNDNPNSTGPIDDAFAEGFAGHGPRSSGGNNGNPALTNDI